MKKTIRLTESELKHIIMENVKKVLRESKKRINENEGDWFNEEDEGYIGRTAAYYEDEDDSIYSPDYWTYDTNPNSNDFAGEVYKLTDEGKDELNYWLRCRRTNEYQRKHEFLHFKDVTPEEEWNLLTTSKRYSSRIR